MRLDFDARRDVQRFIDMAVRRLNDLGLTLSVEGDMAEFKAFYNEQDPKHRLNFPTSLDSAFCDLPGTSFWLKVMSDDGPVGCHGQKLFLTDDFIEALHLHLCYGDRTPSLEWEEIALRPEAAALAGQIRGRVVMGGGLWVDRTWRGPQHALMIFNRVNRALALRHWLPDWLVGFLDYRPSRLTMATSPNGAAYANAVRLSDGVYPPSVMIGKPPSPRPMLFAYSSAAECLQIIRNELAADADRHTRSRPAAPAAAAAPHI